MNSEFPNISILGGGLLGGSLALALGESLPAARVRLWARKRETVETALRLGIAGANGDLADAVDAAELVILAVPVGSMPMLVSQALDAGLPDGCIITDVGSVKRAPHLSIPPLIEGRGIEFIGSHPMAGSERNGLEAATADLFRNAACLLTNDHNAAAPRTAVVESLWQAVGCRTAWMSASIHDELVARISHLPHVLAASGARICIKDASEGRFGGGGLRDTTRVASGNPEMWAEILTENREALLGPIRETLADLAGILAILEAGDQEATRQWLAAAKHQRDLLQAPN
jgi:prephenate dehydrogenase